MDNIGPRGVACVIPWHQGIGVPTGVSGHQCFRVGLNLPLAAQWKSPSPDTGLLNSEHESHKSPSGEFRPRLYLVEPCCLSVGLLPGDYYC